MSVPRSPNPAKLVIGFFLKEKDVSVTVAKALSERFGAVDMASSWLPFEFTDYYEPEMGKPLLRRMLAFKRLIGQDELAAIKTATNDLEQDFFRDGKRRVNLDPGYLLLERFVLATGKNYAHRIYIGRRIYADLTLIYAQGGYRELPWTYPDYSDLRMLSFLERVRKKYASDLKTNPQQKIPDD